LDWIELSQDKDDYWAAMNTVFTYQVSKSAGYFLTN